MKVIFGERCKCHAEPVMAGIVLNEERSTGQDGGRSAAEDNNLCVKGWRGLRKLMESSNSFVKITLFFLLGESKMK